MMKRRLRTVRLPRSRRRLALYGAVAIAGLSAPWAYSQTQSGSNPQEAQPPSASAAASSDQKLAGLGDKAAATRMIEAAGWRTGPSGPRLEARSAEAGGYTLWAYEGAAGSEAVLVGATDQLGGVHVDCAVKETSLQECGNAVDSTGHALVVGTATPGARVVVVLDDGSQVATTSGGGYWYARLPFSARGSLPASVRSFSPEGRPLTSAAVPSLRGSIVDALGRIAAERG